MPRARTRPPEYVEASTAFCIFSLSSTCVPMLTIMIISIVNIIRTKTEMMLIEPRWSL